jgi:hypothetical protein
MLIVPEQHRPKFRLTRHHQDTLAKTGWTQIKNVFGTDPIFCKSVLPSLCRWRTDFPLLVYCSIDTMFRITRFGPNGCEGVLTEVVAFDDDGEELPALLSQSDDDEDWVLKFNEVKLKSKL